MSNDRETGVVISRKAELALTRSAPLVKCGLLRLEANDKAERLFDEGLNHYIHREFDRAVECFRRALNFKPDDVEIHCKLAESLISPFVGHGLRRYEEMLTVHPSLIRRIFTHFRTAAIGGQPDAQAFLGYMYRDGDGIEQDDALAFFWMHRAAQHGRPCIQNQVGLMYEYGRGVERNLGKAAYWYRLVAEQDGYFERSQMTELQKSIAGHNGGFGRPGH